MNKKPFLEIGIGEIFSTSRNSTIPVMKTGNHAGVVLVSYTDNGEEVARGTMCYFPTETLVEVPEQQEFTLPRLPAAPVESRRKPWELGQTLKVGPGLKRRLPVFHGLYVHAGRNDRIGAYYSNDGNQIMFLDQDDAKSQAKSEGVILVIIDALNPPEYAMEATEATA